MKTIALIWVRLGPYHLARLRYAAKTFHGRNISVVAIELVGKDKTYEWNIETSDKDSFQRITLFPDADYARLSQKVIADKLSGALDQMDPSYVAIGGWVLPPARAALAWCRRQGRTAILFF